MITFRHERIVRSFPQRQPPSLGPRLRDQWHGRPFVPAVKDGTHVLEARLLGTLPRMTPVAESSLASRYASVRRKRHAALEEMLASIRQFSGGRTPPGLPALFGAIMGVRDPLPRATSRRRYHRHVAR